MCLLLLHNNGYLDTLTVPKCVCVCVCVCVRACVRVCVDGKGSRVFASRVRGEEQTAVYLIGFREPLSAPDRFRPLNSSLSLRRHVESIRRGRHLVKAYITLTP